MSVLIIGYKRAEEIKRVIEKVSNFRPKKLYLAMDGPKDLKSRKLCLLARKTALKSIDWDCTIKTNFAEDNKGLREFIMNSIDWFFSFEKEGLILEDDILIHSEFPKFAKYYINKDNIGCISACTFDSYLKNNQKNPEYTFLSKIPSIWGWYCTKKTWESFRNWERPQESPIIYFIKLKKRIGFWQSFIFAMIIDYINQNKLSTWDYDFAYYLIINNKFTIFPGICMAENIGNSSLATNSKCEDELSPKLSKYNINLSKIEFNPILNKKYMNNQSLNIMIKNEYKIQALKSLIKYLIKSFFRFFGLKIYK
tara:strand:+ start:17254 stop:18183 length:930 start_codon:yes stop_codon:yes gene_type:complete